MITSLVDELRLALRRLATRPGFTALAILTMALATGANAAIFSLADALFLQPLPVARPERLVGVYESRGGTGFHPLSLPDYLDYRRAARSFSGLAAHYPTAPLSLLTGDGTEEVNGSVVSADYFRVLGIAPERGRFFLPGEGRPAAAEPAAVVSDGFWRSRLGTREDVLGTVIHLNGTAFTVVGVAPPGFTGVLKGLPSELWIPMSAAGVGYRWCDPASRDCTWLNLVGRLAPGATLASARTEMAGLSRRIRRAHPPAPTEDPVARGVRLAPLTGVHPAARAGALRLTALLVGAVTLLLLVAGANLSGLLVASSLARRRETAVRLALGAPRRRVVAPYLAEALVLALAGGAGGLLVAGWLGRLVALLYPSDVPLDVGVTPAVVGYAALLAGVTGVAVGLVAGLQAARPDLAPALGDEVTLGSRRRPRLLAALVVLQVALSFVLVSATGLLTRSLAGVGRSGGPDPASVAILRLRPRLVGYPPERAQAFTRRVTERLEGLPGVVSVSLGSGSGHGLHGDPVDVNLLGQSMWREGGGPTAWTNEVAPRFFETYGVAILRGRGVEAGDRAGSPKVAVVNRTLATMLWPDSDPVGSVLLVEGEPHQVVGVVADAVVRSVDEGPAPQVYTSYWQDPANVDSRLAARVDGDAGRLLPALRRTILAVDPVVPVTEVGTLRDRLAQAQAPTRLVGRVLGASAALTLFLSAVGLYGVLALAVARRRREIAIRMALGGERSQVVALVARDALVLLAAALGLGLAAALAASRVLAHYLFGVSPRDPATFAAALAVLAAAGALAAWTPARRAARLDPVAVLKGT